MTPDSRASREQRRVKRARAFWSFLGIAFILAAPLSFIVGRPAAGLAFLVSLVICLAAVTRSGRPDRARNH